MCCYIFILVRIKINDYIFFCFNYFGYKMVNDICGVFNVDIDDIVEFFFRNLL